MIHSHYLLPKVLIQLEKKIAPLTTEFWLEELQLTVRVKKSGIIRQNGVGKISSVVQVNSNFLRKKFQSMVTMPQDYHKELLN